MLHALLGSVAVLVAPAARPIELRWSAPEECPSAPDVEVRLDGKLRGTEVEGERITARAVVVREPLVAGGSRFALELTIELGGARSRFVERARACSALADATVLLVAMAAEGGIADGVGFEDSEAPGDEPENPDAAAVADVNATRGSGSIAETDTARGADVQGAATGIAATRNARAATREAESPRSKLSAAERRRLRREKMNAMPELRRQRKTREQRAEERRRRAERRERPAFDMSVFTGVGSGRVPNLDIALGLRFGVAWTNVRLEFDVRHDFASLEEIDPQLAPGSGIEVSMTSAAIGLCAVVGRNRWYFVGCGRAEGGIGIGQGVQVPESQVRVLPQMQVALGPHLFWRPHPKFGVRVGVEGAVGLIRPKFTLEDGSFEFSPPQLSVEGVLSLVWRPV